MKIIDAHLHIFPPDAHTNAMAAKVGHENSVEHLRKVYGELGYVHGVVMGNRSLDPEAHDYPPDLFHYCVGLDSFLMDRGRRVIPDLAEKVEANLKRENCCGVKLYPGYNRIWLTDPMYEPVYELAARYDKPVAVHMGLTAFPGASLKYCHPMALDEAAADHRHTRFVMCHFGYPFFETSCAVLEKNPNVAVDLSGLLEGPLDLPRFLREQQDHLGGMRTWLNSILKWDDVMYGTDWPIVNLGDYVKFMQWLIPEKHWEKVFFANANRIYGLGLQ